MKQHQAVLTLAMGHCCNLFWVLLANHRKEQVEDIVVQHAVIVPPVGIQHLPQHPQHLIVPTRRDKPVRNTHRHAPLLGVLKQEQISIQKVIVMVIVNVARAQHSAINPRPSVFYQQF